MFPMQTITAKTLPLLAKITSLAAVRHEGRILGYSRFDNGEEFACPTDHDHDNITSAGECMRSQILAVIDSRGAAW